MIGTTNAVGSGGGLKSTDAILRVIAPAGSTVTISKGAVSKSDLGHENSDDSSVYDYYFIVHASQFDSVNPWTVTATLGSDTASDTVTIDVADEYDVELSFTLYLVHNGIDTGKKGSLTALGWSAISGATAQAPTITQEVSDVKVVSAGSAGYTGVAYYPTAVNMSQFNTMYITVQSVTDSSYSKLYVWSSVGSGHFDTDAIAKTSSFSGTNTYSIDVSALSGNYYIGTGIRQGTSAGQYKITEWWCE